MSISEGSKKLVIFLGIGFVAISFFVASGIRKYKENLLDISYKVNSQKINDSINIMSYNGDFLYSPMYTEKEPSNYDETSGEFLKSYMEVKEYCGSSNGTCFAPKYKDLDRKIYTPEYKGACAILKNGASICLVPQIRNNDITAIIDVNGKAGPNVYGKDLRDIVIKAHSVVVSTPEPESDVIE